MSSIPAVGPGFAPLPDLETETPTLPPPPPQAAPGSQSIPWSRGGVCDPNDNGFHFTNSAPPTGTGTAENQAWQAMVTGAMTGAALVRTAVGLTDQDLEKGLSGLALNAPLPGEPTASADYTSRACAPPEQLFRAFVDHPGAAFAASGLTLHPEPKSLEDGGRFFIEDRSGPVPVWAPVEVQVDEAKRTVTLTCLDGHPLRGVNHFEFASDGADGTEVKQQSDFQGSSTLPTALGVHVLGAIERQHEIWRGVHQHLATVEGK